MCTNSKDLDGVGKVDENGRRVDLDRRQGSQVTKTLERPNIFPRDLLLGWPAFSHYLKVHNKDVPFQEAIKQRGFVVGNLKFVALPIGRGDIVALSIKPSIAD